MIDCSKMSWLFLRMGFVKSNGSDEDQALLANIWRQVGGDEDGRSTVPLQYVKVFMCAILNFHIDWIIDLERENQLGVNPNNLGRIFGMTLLLKSEEISYITKKYVRLYKNRQDMLQEEIKMKKQLKSIEKQKLGEQPTFQPKELSNKNKQLALSASVKDPRRQSMSISDRLYEENFDKIRRKNQYAKEKEIQERNNSYRPNVSNYNTKLAMRSRKSIAMRSMDHDGSKWDHFYLDHKRNLSKRDIETDERKYLDEQQECTFKPNISKMSYKALNENSMSPGRQRSSKYQTRMTNKAELDMGAKRKRGTSAKVYESRDGGDSSDLEVNTL